MQRYYTNTDLNKALKDLVIITDTREQVNDHVLSYFDDNGISHKERKLDSGDYSAMLGEYTFETDVVIERKHNLDEICVNFTSERERFEREFLRCKALGIKVFLVIEEGSIDDVFLGNYRSKLDPKSLAASLFSWQSKYNVTVLFCNKKNTGRLIYGILYYFARERLAHGNG